MLKNKTVFDPDRLVAALSRNWFGPGRGQPGRLTGCAQTLGPNQSQSKISGASAPPLCVGPSEQSGALIGSCGQVPGASWLRCWVGVSVPLPTEASEGDRKGHLLCCFLRSQTMGSKPSRVDWLATITSERLWSIRPSGRSAQNWNRTRVGNDPRCESRLPGLAPKLHNKKRSRSSRSEDERNGNQKFPWWMFFPYWPSGLNRG